MSPDEQSSDTGFYDEVYGSFAERLNATIRAEAFGEEIGQSSWVTAGEYRAFARRLGLDASCHVLEVASGSGGRRYSSRARPVAG